MIAEELPDGQQIVRFEPVPAWETPETIAALCNAFEAAMQDAELDPLLLIPILYWTSSVSTPSTTATAA